MSVIVTITNIGLALAIAYFAYQTWKTTQSYARTYGLMAFLEQFKKILTLPEDAERRASRESLRMIFKEFPQIYTQFEQFLPEEVKQRR